MHKETLPQIIKDMVSQPIIWSVLLFVVVADITTEIYHRTCFPLYGIPYIKRSDYIRIDRHKLKYLTFLEKIGCAYCGYTNGWLHYASAIAAETERYWCHIKHRVEPGDTFKEPKHHKSFQEYGDVEAFSKSKKVYEEN